MITYPPDVLGERRRILNQIKMWQEEIGTHDEIIFYHSQQRYRIQNDIFLAQKRLDEIARANHIPEETKPIKTDSKLEQLRSITPEEMVEAIAFIKQGGLS